MHKIFIAVSILLFISSIVFSQDSLVTLHVSSDPSGAQIFIDDMLSGSRLTSSQNIQGTIGIIY